ncbi:MAG: CotH kinase family protein [Tunicatimonas sp.]
MKSFSRFAPLGLLVVLCLLSVGSQAQVNFTSSNLPIIVINTDGAEIVDEPKINVFMGVINNPPGQRNNLTDPFTDYQGTIGIEIRGATSQNYPKKQYSVELRDPDGKDTAVALLGMPKEADWVLNAPYGDKSLMRNILAYQLGRDLGHYAPRTKLCEVVLNGDYRGVYVLIEKIKRDKNRVDIAKLNDDEISGDDLTGGYIIKIDRDTEGGEDGWASAYAPRYREEDNQRIYFRYEYPDTDDIAPEQKTYIQNYVKAFEDALAGDDFADPEKGYAPYIDVNSFIDYFIVNEVSKNIDAYRLSTYMHKQKDSDGGKLVMGPLWDYNFSFGNVEFCGIMGDPESFAMDFNQRCPGDFWLVPFWWERFMEDPAYSDRLAVRWSELRTNQLSTARLVARVDSVATLVDEARARNFARWPILGEYIWPNAFVGETYQEELDYLKNWTTQRLTWLDENLPEPPPPVVVPDPVPPTVPTDSVPTDTTTTNPPPADSVVTSIDREELSDETPVVYPNPFSNELSLRFTTQQASTTAVLVHDLLGRMVLRSTTYYSTADEQQLSLETSSLPPGIYVLELQVGDQALVTRKISKR